MSYQNASSSNVKRNLADFHPTVWGNLFINNDLHRSHSNMIALWKGNVNILKEEVKKIITSCDDTSQVLNLVDVIQRMGVGYHFEGEIEQHLKKILKKYEHSCLFYDVDDLHTIALGFRLLRQRGYYVSTNVFDKFKDRDGKFKPSDVQGLLSLYKASYLSINGEDSLDEALIFATTQLKLIVESSNSPFVDQISHALKFPIRRNVEKEEAWHCISMHENDEGNIQPLLQLAKLDFNIAQFTHHEEVVERLWFCNKVVFCSR